ncbi:hypothetical protein OsI_15613 [Oryza sativa Indica Group]|uniref:Uncharacterized protein n=1 Tax=Oryza sativa subsp. indica TaxID=39946 RepID=B8AT27_ORYSI|nr:hypothetical protein OsI_15613 [Oryza sativa Indica Group]
MVRMLTIMRCKPSITDKVILKLTVHNDPITVKCVIQVAFIVVAIQEFTKRHALPILHTTILALDDRELGPKGPNSHIG